MAVADSHAARPQKTDHLPEAVERRVADALAALSLEQKVRLLTGADFWSTHPEPAIGPRRMVVSDGLVGVRGERWDERDPQVCLLPPPPSRPRGTRACWSASAPRWRRRRGARASTSSWGRPSTCTAARSAAGASSASRKIPC